MLGIIAFAHASAGILAGSGPKILVKIIIAAAQSPPIDWLIVRGQFHTPRFASQSVGQYKGGAVRRHTAKVIVVIEKRGQRQRHLFYWPDAIAKFISNHFFRIKIRSP